MLLDKAISAVQKLCKQIIGLPHDTTLVDRRPPRVDSPGGSCFLAPVDDVTSGETGFSAGAEGATAPETLRQTDRVTD
jgi:hypothetical protein